jgi:hypothetical protein
MKFICAQPAIDYYTWQVEVLINNFTNNGISPNDIQIVSAHYGSVPDKWKKLQETYKDVNFYFYKDERVKPSYISSVRPHILHQHWLLHPELATETIFYHDCDIVLSKPFNLHHLLTDNMCYVSDTVSYIGANYVKSKGDHYMDLMSRIVNVDRKFIESQEQNSGGAQYIIKNVTAQFWSKVYYDSETLYRLVSDQIAKDKAANPSIHEIQIWCADMWAVLWNLWFFGKQVRVSNDMSFSWATSSVQAWDMHNIYHNAGVTGDRKDLFFKGIYQSKMPYDIKLEDFSPNFCSYNYVKEILKTKEVSCLK